MSPRSVGSQFAVSLLRGAGSSLRDLLRSDGLRPPGTVASPTRRRNRSRGAAPAPGADYPGDFRGVPDIAYAPHPDGEPDPGEVVWTWVPYEEDHSQGKDRPVLLIGRDGRWLLGLQLTSKDHDRDEEQERRAGREWYDLGAGAWDRRGRDSEARVNRIVRIDPDTVRREGAVLDRARFEAVAAAVRDALG